MKDAMRVWVVLLAPISAMSVPGCEGGMTATGIEPDAARSEGGTWEDDAVDFADAGSSPDAAILLADSGAPPADFAAYLPSMDSTSCTPSVEWTPRVDVSRFRVRTVCTSGCDFDSIDAAFEAAQPYDDIRVAPGVYEGCLTLPTTIVRFGGDGGFLEIDGSSCTGNAVRAIQSARMSEYVHLHDLKVTNIALSTHHRFAVEIHGAGSQTLVERLWVEGSNSTMFRSAYEGAEVWIRQSKANDAGWYDENIMHSTALVTVANGSLVVTESVFSNPRNKSWILSTSHHERLEFLCNVIVRSPGAPSGPHDHYFHISYPRGPAVYRGNYMEERYGGIITYVYNPGLEFDFHYTLVENEILFRRSDGDYIGNMGPTKVHLIDNRFLGGIDEEQQLRNRALREDYRGNTYGSVGSDEGPIPAGWPLERL